MILLVQDAGTNSRMETFLVGTTQMPVCKHLDTINSVFLFTSLVS